MGAPHPEAGELTPAESDAALARVAINVANLSRSEKTYRDVLGFTRVRQYPPDSAAPIAAPLRREITH